jgi:tetratricopeptide (TPR) repeat protein
MNTASFRSFLFFVLTARLFASCLYAQYSNYEKVIGYHTQSLKIKEGKGNKEELSKSYGNLGSVYDDLSVELQLHGAGKDTLRKTLEMSLMNYQKALELSKAASSKAQTEISYLNIGRIQLRLGHLNLASQSLKKAIEMGKELGDEHGILNSYYILSSVDSAAGNFKDALMHYKLYIDYAEKESKEQDIRSTTQAQLQYEFDKRFVADSLKNAQETKREELKHEEEVKQQRLIAYGGVTCFCVMILVVGISYRANKRKQKDNAVIMLQKNLVEEKQKEIVDSIQYARRIQSALITNENYIRKELKKLNKYS